MFPIVSDRKKNGGVFSLKRFLDPSDILMSTNVFNIIIIVTSVVSPAGYCLRTPGMARHFAGHWEKMD